MWKFFYDLYFFFLLFLIWNMPEWIKVQKLFIQLLTLKWYTKGFPFHENIFCIIPFKVNVFLWSIFLCFPKWTNIQGLIKVQKLFINLFYARHQSQCTLLMWHNLLIHLDKNPRNPQYLHHLGLCYCFPNMAVLLPLASFAAIVSLVSNNMLLRS